MRQTARENVTACPVCETVHGSFDEISFDEGKEPRGTPFLFSRCRGCGVLFLSTRVPEARIRDYYPDDYEPYVDVYNRLSELFVEWRTKRELARIRRLIPGARSLLEVGPSWGRYLVTARLHGGFDVTGVELSADMCEKGRKLGLDMRAGTLEQQRFPDRSFDVVVMNHVLERLYHPRETVREVHRVLRPGGLLLIRTPNERTPERSIFGRYWDGYDVPRHTVLFRESTLSALLGEESFRVLHLKYEKIPNNLISSARAVLERVSMPMSFRRLVSIKRYGSLALLTPVSLLLGGLKASGRMVLVAQREERSAETKPSPTRSKRSAMESFKIGTLFGAFLILLVALVAMVLATA